MKKYYHRLAMRERSLLLGFLVLLGGLWLWGDAIRGARFGQRWRDHRAEADSQELWLARRDSIEASAKQAARTLRPELTLDATKLFSEINQLARGLTCEIGGERTDQSDYVAIHLVQVTLRKVDMDALLRFQAALQKRAPYIGVEQCELAVDRSEAGRLNASFRIYAIQVRTPAKI